MRDLFIQLAYLTASVLFIIGLRSLTRPDQASQGIRLAAIGMVLAIVGTLVNHDIVRYDWIIVGLVVGSILGVPLGLKVPMTSVPQQIAISHMFGAIAATLVGVAEFWHDTHGGGELGAPKMAALGLEVILGSLTATGSFMAFGKLQGIVRDKPVTYPGQNATNLSLFGFALLLFLYQLFEPGAPLPFYVMLGIGFLIGVLIVLPIGGADMPVVISLLNSYAGLAAAATGFAIGNNVLIICGALEGVSGFLLSVIMSKAMNRSFSNVIFGAFGGAEGGPAAITDGRDLTVKSVSAEDAAIQLAYARKVIVIPGYGMAVAQSQHQVRELQELIEKKGGEVVYAIHPVAGRMPGHMNVLLAEANVPYDKLKEMEEINDEFDQADVALVIGANDVVNPAARTETTSPIYGMPILNADHAKSIIVLKRSMGAGFAGIENMLFYDPKTSMLFGDAKASLTRLVAEVKGL